MNLSWKNGLTKCTLSNMLRYLGKRELPLDRDNSEIGEVATLELFKDEFVRAPLLGRGLHLRRTSATKSFI